MKTLHAESQLPVDAKTAWELFESEEFRTRLAEQSGVVATIVDQRMDGEIEVTRLSYVTAFELPRVAAKLLGSSRLEYEQTNRLDLAKGELAWTIKIPAAGERLKVGGLTSIVDRPGGSLRTVHGTIEVAVRLVGGQIEKVVASGFQGSMDKAVDVVRGMIAERGLA